MINKKISLLIFLFLILMLVGLTSTLSKEKIGVHPLLFYDLKAFSRGIEIAEKITQPNYKIIGGITPHHLEVSFIINDFYKKLSFQKPTTIILLGPNHYERGHFKALTSLYGWNTPYGTVEADDSIINTLVSRNLIHIDENTLPKDHAVAGSMSFIKYYIPKAKVVPILLSGTMTEKESSLLADNLATFIKVGVVIVAPVDFSHYLTNKQAQEKDKITYQVMKDFDFRQLFSFNNDYLDSPASIGTILMVMQRLGTTKMDLLYHSNSGEIQRNDYIQTTSYFEIAFY